MDFALTEKQKSFKAEVAAFVDGWDKAQIKALERDSLFPQDLYRALSARGWAGVMVPASFGGMGLGAIEMAIITEEFGRIGFSGLALTLHGQRTLLKLGTPAQQQKYLPGLTRGELLSAIVVSEPDVGSSLKHMKTTATRRDGFYIINGLKHHITLGDEASLYITFTLTEKGLTTFLVDRHAPGIRVKKLDAIGWCLEPHYEVAFDDVRVPADQMLGAEGQGIQTFFASFNLTRICNASHLIGVARSAIDDAVAYATRRTVGDSKVADFQGIQWMIADLAVKLQTAQLVRDKAAWMEDAGLKHETETAMAKLLAVELVDAAANKAFSIVGGYGSYRTTSFERYLRDAKIGHVTGGSPEIMRNNIARAVLREHGYRPPKAG
jgi:alkylation response protein AidB-like acyl-CoA dehydrogenase